MTELNNEQWGNVELPGLSDDKLLNTNWNRVSAGKENKHNPKLLAQAAAKKGNKEFGKTMSKVASNRDQEYWQKHQQGVEQRDNTYQAISNARPEVQAKISAKMTGKEKTAEHIAKVAEKSKERGLPCITPLGVFRTGADAGRAYNEQRNVTNGKNAVNGALKKGKPGYKYISIEEYIMLTGKDVA